MDRTVQDWSTCTASRSADRSSRLLRDLNTISPAEQAEPLSVAERSSRSRRVHSAAALGSRQKQLHTAEFAELVLSQALAARV